MDEGFDEDCRWPRRLLHVESLTSHPWKRGNVYGGYVQPRYHAISYTWGRWRERDRPELGYEPFPVQGATWEKHLPRMKKDAEGSFTPEELHDIVRVAARPCDGLTPVDFVWLDIACIDQTPDSMMKAREVGRQAMIFRNAAECFVWLRKLDTTGMIEWGYAMEKLVQQARSLCEDSPDALRVTCLQESTRLLGIFTRDHWFTSLWTLQEAFLCPEAIFLFQDGLTSSLLDICKDGEGNLERLFTLESWVQTFNMLHAVFSFNGITCPGHDAEKEFFSAIEDVGFIDGVRDQWHTWFLHDRVYRHGAMGNPFHLLAASSRRKCRELDKIYGIMQIFELRLGTARLGDETKTFSLEDLTYQLSEELLVKYPISSQLVIHPEAEDPCKAWMMTSSVSLPEVAYRAWNHQVDGGQMSTLVQFSTAKHKAAIWAAFEGPMSSLQHWIQVYGGHLPYPRLIVDEGCQRKMAISCSAAAGIRETIAWLQRTYENAKLLLLGYLSTPPGIKEDPMVNEFYDWGIALILCPDNGSLDPSTYSRLGVLIWDFQNFIFTPSFSLEDLNYLEGKGDGWVRKEGIFG